MRRGARATRSAVAIRGERGASAVEFALVASLLFLLLIGIVQFGFTFMQYLEVVHSAREGARWASIRPAGGVGSVTDDGTVRNRVWTATPGLAPRLTDANIAVAVDGVAREGAFSDTDTGKPVVVTVTYESSIIIPPMNIFFGDVIELTSSATQMVE
jgi:Flp pilus assembly protein TadG